MILPTLKIANGMVEIVVAQMSTQNIAKNVNAWILMEMDLKKLAKPPMRDLRKAETKNVFSHSFLMACFTVYARGIWIGMNKLAPGMMFKSLGVRPKPTPMANPMEEPIGDIVIWIHVHSKYEFVITLNYQEINS